MSACHHRLGAKRKSSKPTTNAQLLSDNHQLRIPTILIIPIIQIIQIIQIR